MKKYYLESNKPNFFLSLVDKTGFRSQLANEIFNCVMNCIEGGIDFSEFSEPHNFDAEFHAITNQPFISDLENCKSDLSKISDRKFYADITQRFADVVNKKNNILKILAPHDFVITYKKDLMKSIRKYYYLKSIQKRHLGKQIPANESIPPSQNVYVVIYNDFSDRSSKTYNYSHYFDNTVNNYNYQTNQKVIFKNEMTIETYRHLNFENIITTIRQKHFEIKLDTAEKHSAWIIDYFIWKDNNFSKRKNLLEECYGLTYDQFRRNHQWPIIDSKSNFHLEISDLEKAILYVDARIEKKYLQNIFKIDLLEEMIRFYEIVRS